MNQPRNQNPELSPEFLQNVTSAIASLKSQLEQDYGQAYPALAEIMHLVIDEEEARAWQLSSFPHLVLPGLVEAHVTRLNLLPLKTKQEEVLAQHSHSEVPNLMPAFAFCG